MPGGEIAIQASLHPNPRGSWVTFTITVGGIRELAVVLDPGSPVSVISPETRDEFLDLNLLSASARPGYFRLAPITVQGQLLPDLEVRILPRLTDLKVAGLVGLDFLSKFVWIRFHVPTPRPGLEDP